jgi:DNA processing protein
VDSERIAYLALTQVPGMGAARLQTLLTACKTAIGAHSAPIAFLRALPGFSGPVSSELKTTPLESGLKVLEDAAKLGASVLIPTDAGYPDLLRTIPEPPPVLFTLGQQALFESPAAAIVGSRDHSSYGQTVCRSLATAAAEVGVVVVSGMARGLDAVAHTGALDAGGNTIGVLGNGLGVIYPAANRALYERVAQKGLLVTEFPPGERPHAGSFPQRNRLISGLARVTVVVEAAVGSGALITAGSALDQGREVMAVPGNITSPVSAGANRLIRDGAAPVVELDDLMQHFPELRVTKTKRPPAAATRPLPDTLLPEERELADLMGPMSIHPDELANRFRRPIGEVLGLLSALEIAGVVQQAPGRQFRRI